MYRFSGFAENLNIWKYVNSTWNCVHQMNGVFGFAENLNFVDTLNVQNCANSTENCVHQMYRLSRFAENLNIQNFVNQMYELP